MGTVVNDLSSYSPLCLAVMICKNFGDLIPNYRSYYLNIFEILKLNGAKMAEEEIQDRLNSIENGFREELESKKGILTQEQIANVETRIIEEVNNIRDLLNSVNNTEIVHGKESFDAQIIELLEKKSK